MFASLFSSSSSFHCFSHLSLSLQVLKKSVLTSDFERGEVVPKLSKRRRQLDEKVCHLFSPPDFPFGIL